MTNLFLRNNAIGSAVIDGGGLA